MELLIDFIGEYVSFHGLLSLALGVALIVARPKFDLPRIALYLGILFAALGVISVYEAATTMEMP